MASKIVVRPYRLTDCYFLWKLRNLEDVRKVSWHTEYIRPWAHLRWFFRAYFLKESLIWIAWYWGEIRCGYLRIDGIQNSHRAVSVAVSPRFRKRGVGRAMLQTAMDEIFLWNEEIVLVATINTDNVASQRLFQSCGFTQKGPMIWEYHYGL